MAMEQITVTDIDQVKALIEDDSTNWDNVVVSPILFKCSIKIIGEGYEASISGTLIKGLSAYQDAVFRTYAVAKYGSDGLKSLTDKEREVLNVWFYVKPGCSDILADLNGLVNGLKGIVCDMDPKTRAFLLIGIAGIIGASWVIDNFNEYQRDIAVAKIEADTKRHSEDVHHETIKTISEDHRRSLESIVAVAKTNEVVADTLMQASKGFTVAREQVIKNSGSATEIRIGGKTYTEQEIRDIQSPAERVRGKWLQNETINAEVVAIDRTSKLGTIGEFQ